MHIHTESYLFTSFVRGKYRSGQNRLPTTARGSSPGVDAALGPEKSQVAACLCRPPPLMHVYIWFTRETSLQWGSRKGGEGGRTRLPLPFSSVGGAAKLTHHTKELTSDMAWVLAQELAQSILRLLNISGRTGARGASGKQVNSNPCGGTWILILCGLAGGSARPRGTQGGA